jgi:hypothetical protein
MEGNIAMPLPLQIHLLDSARRLEDIQRRREGRGKAHPRAAGNSSARRQVPSRAVRAARDEEGAE